MCSLVFSIAPRVLKLFPVLVVSVAYLAGHVAIVAAVSMATTIS